MTTTPYFFVYGTLKQGYGNNILMGASEFIGKAVTVDHFVMIDGGFPYVMEDLSLPSFPVMGELYRVDDTYTERRLDALEGVEYDHYVREQRTVKVNGEDVLANIYIASESTATEIVESILHDRRDYANVKDGSYVWGHRRA